MTVDATKPTETEFVDTHAGYIRTLAAAMNALELNIQGVVATEFDLTTGDTTMDIDADISDALIEVLRLDMDAGGGTADIATITGGTQGQIKIIIIEDTGITFSRSASQADGTIWLNQTAGASDYGGTVGDILCLVNIDGNPATPTEGYWKELFRTAQVT